MELTLQINRDTTGEAYGRLGTPCRGYLTNFRVWIKDASDGFILHMGRKGDFGTFRTIEDIKPSPSGLYVALNKVSSGTPQLATGWSKKKIWVTQDDDLFVYCYDVGIIDVLIQATFVPMKGEILKVRHVMTPDLDGPLSVSQEPAYVVPLNGVLVGVQANLVLYETTGSSGSAFQMDMYHFPMDSHLDYDGNVTGQGDIFADQGGSGFLDQIKYSQNRLASWLLRSIDEEPQLFQFQQATEQAVRMGDHIVHSFAELAGGGGLPDYSQLELIYHIKVSGTPMITVGTEHIEFQVLGSAGTTSDYFVDYGSGLFTG